MQRIVLDGAEHGDTIKKPSNANPFSVSVSDSDPVSVSVSDSVSDSVSEN
jgi:hypothetical protein